MNVHTQDILQKCTDPSRFLRIFHFSVGLPDEKKAKLHQKLIRILVCIPNFTCKIKLLSHLLTLPSCSVLFLFNCLTLSCLSKLISISLCRVWSSVRVAFTDTASTQLVCKHDVTCVPISARLPRRLSRLWWQRNLENAKSWERFWFSFCLRMLWFPRPLICPSVHLSVRVLFCFCVIYVYSAATVAPERACLFRRMSDYHPLTFRGWSWCFPARLGQISKKDAGIYEVVLKDDRGKDTSKLNLKDQGNLDWVAQLRPSPAGESLFTSSSRFQRLDEWGVQLHR